MKSHSKNVRQPIATWRRRRRKACIGRCRGAVAVEFAVVAPVLLAITLGVVELTRIYESQNLLATAAREGARFASMDKEGIVGAGESTNAKLVEDVTNFLASNGIPAEGIEVSVQDHEDPSKDFDLDDPANELKLFEVHVSVDYSAVSFASVAAEDDYALTAKVVFRNGMATINE